MKPVVLDASVVAKWLPMLGHEGLVAEARELRRRWENGEIEIAVPDFFWIEIAAILWKTQRKGLCDATAAEAGLQHLLTLNIPTVNSYGFIQEVLKAAMGYERSVYDSVYVALARTLGCEFVTADQKLVNAVAGRLPVRWLGTVAM